VLSYWPDRAESGSDAAALKTKLANATERRLQAERTKAFISGGGYFRRLMSRLVRTWMDGCGGGPLSLWLKTNEGLSFLAGLEDKMGGAASRTVAGPSLTKLPTFLPEILVGEEGKGFKYAMMGLDGRPFEPSPPVPWGLRRPR